MSDYQGIIIEESLEDKEVLNQVKIISTRVEKVGERHETPWLSQWTLHTFEIEENKACGLADLLSKSLDRAHASEWYADFKNETHHYIVFRDKIFFVDRKSGEEYEEAKNYGISIGIPEHQCDFDMFLLKNK
jgi:hypothetical protein